MSRPMDLTEIVRHRRMARSFSGQQLPRELVDRLIAATLSAPSAGNAKGTDWLLLDGPAETSVYWQHTTTAEWRRESRRWPGLSRAPVIALSLTSPAAYTTRYAELDKATSGLDHTSAWPVPYWFGDAAFATMTLLLAAVEAGIGACFLGNFRGEAALLGALGVPPDRRLFGTVLLGRPDGVDHRSRSLARAGPPDDARVHRGEW